MGSLLLTWATAIGGVVVVLVGIKFLIPRKMISADKLDPDPVFWEWGGDRFAQGLGFLIGGLIMVGFAARGLGFLPWLKAQLY